MFLDDGSLFLDGAVPGAVDAIVLEQELAIDHRGAAVVAAEARRVRVPVHFPVANARLIGPDRSAALVAVLSEFFLVAVEAMRLSFDGRVLVPS